MPDFVHLHCHTEYSLLDGAIRLKDLAAKTAEWKLPAACITDHGNLYAAAKFYTTCLAHEVKPVIGCEVYVAASTADDRETELAKRRFHLVLLAQNMTGYQNLLGLVSKSFLEGFHYKPRVDRRWLASHGEGLIALSACLAGEVPRTLLHHGLDAGIEMARQYAAWFPDRYYLELQDNGIPEQAKVNDMLLKVADATGIPLVATNDCHYLSQEDVQAHDMLLCVQTGKTEDDPNRMRFDTNTLHFRAPEDMAAAFAHCPQAVSNTAEIAARCHLELDLKSYHFPVYELPQGRTLDQELADQARAGLAERLAKLPYREEIDEKAYHDRLELELGVIKDMGFPGYFLIVADFIVWAKEQGIPVGPGRGSAAGSLVAWALMITNLDPIPYNLLFERFLNPERISMPDIDVDFCERRRGEVIKYVCDRYGHDSVAQITTFGTMKAKAVIRDVGRAMGMTFAECDKISKLVPEELKMTLAKALEQEPELADMARSDKRVARLLDISQRLEGLARHASTHAAGVVIGDKPLTHYLPLYRGKKDEIVTQYDMKMVEKVGLIKFDFLGLKTMTVIDDCLKLIGHSGLQPPDLDALPLDDEATYQLYARGDTDGIFQVESDGMRRYLRQLKPSCFEDVIAMLALYRPGPLGSGMVEEFIERKHGTRRVSYPLPELEPVLKDTLGVIVYQEQVMKIAQVVADYSLGEADLLRRAMGKKIEEEMEKQRKRFMEGAAGRGVEKAKATEIFDLMQEFAKYGFNKSHSAAYALISYHTAYLKTHYPTQFMAAMLTSELGNQDKILKYLSACRDMGITVRPPDVNLSYREFTVAEGDIIFGLGAVKNVGDEAIKDIVAARKEGGPFASLLEFLTRVNLRKVTKRVVEALVKSGSLDSLGAPRAALMAALDEAHGRAQRLAARDDSQHSMFSVMEVDDTPKMTPGIGYDCPQATEPEWKEAEKLSFEKEALGLFVSGHPLLRFERGARRLGCVPLLEAAPLEGTVVPMSVILTAMKEHLSKKGKMAFGQVEDLTGHAECVFFTDLFADKREMLKDALENGEPLLIKAKVQLGEAFGEEGKQEVKLVAEETVRMAEALGDMPVEIPLSANELAVGGLDALKKLLARHRGASKVEVWLTLDVENKTAHCRMELGREYRVAPGPDLEADIDAWVAALRRQCAAPPLAGPDVGPGAGPDHNPEPAHG